MNLDDFESNCFNNMQYEFLEWSKRNCNKSNYRYGMFGAAGVLAIILCWSLGCESDQSRARSAIREVLRLDKLYSQETSQKIGISDMLWDGSSIVRELATRMDSIDLSNCPEDFQIAYKRHVGAWATMASVKASNEGFNGFLKGFLTGGLSAIPAMSEIERAHEEILSTWMAVQECAIRHGVTLQML